MASREDDIGGLSKVAAGAAAGSSLGLPGALVGAGLGLVQNLWTARRADTAHQREVVDLRRAGVNPALTAGTRGAEVGNMESIAGSAAAAARNAAELDVLKATADRERANALFARVQAGEVMSYSGGRAAEVQMRTAVLSMELSQRRQLLPSLLAQAQQEVGLTMAGARAARARAALDEAAERGALNEEEFQRMIGEYGPWTRLFIDVLRSIAPGGFYSPPRR